MNRIFCLMLLPVLTVSCIGKHESDAQKVVVRPVIDGTFASDADTVHLNMAKSKIDWIATEMRGTKRRTGNISFKDGYLLTTNTEIVGGKFEVDMATMDVTDIPVHEKIARKNLIEHLKSDDFFNVEDYPISTLEITRVEKLETDSLKIAANLTIREVTKNIEFRAQREETSFSTHFTFNRLDWNIAYKGSWADKTLIDKDVELVIEMVTE